MKDFSEAISDARDFDAKLVAGLQNAVAHTVTVATAKARSEHAWQDRTGDTRQSITGEVSDRFAGAEGTILAGENAERLNDGTRAHVITARDRVSQGRDTGGRFASTTSTGMLRFQIGGRTVFARSVNHPGTKGDHFLDAAAEAAGEELVTAVEHVLDDALG